MGSLFGYTSPDIINRYQNDNNDYSTRGYQISSRSGLVSEAGTDEEIVYLISAASPARWLGPGARHRTGRCYSSRDSLGASAACQGPSGFDDSGQQSQSVATQLGQLVAYNGCE